MTFKAGSVLLALVCAPLGAATVGDAVGGLIPLVPTANVAAAPAAASVASSNAPAVATEAEG